MDDLGSHACKTRQSYWAFPKNYTFQSSRKTKYGCQKRKKSALSAANAEDQFAQPKVLDYVIVEGFSVFFSPL